MNKSILIFIVVISLFRTASAAGIDQKLNIPFYPQGDRCWCGMAVTEMWLHYAKNTIEGVTWNNYSDRQDKLTKYHGFVGSYINSTDVCGSKGGLLVKEFAAIINDKDRMGAGYVIYDAQPVVNDVSEAFHKIVVDA